MKTKIFAFLLALVMLLSLTACGQKKTDGGESKMGTIDDLLDFNAFSKHKNEIHKEVEMAPPELMTYSNLSAALLAMEAGQITNLSVSKSTADYIAARNDKFKVNAKTEAKNDNSHFSMLISDDNTALYDILNNGIKQLKADGTLDKLIAEDLNAYITSDPAPEALPTFDGAATYKIAVTGDMPPMDFVTADGKAAGFNVALLTEIANIAKVNFELVMVDSGARLTSLASGAVDAVFWMESGGCFFCGEILSAAPEGTILTESYFSDVPMFLTLK